MAHGCNTGRPIPEFEDHARFLKFISINKETDCWEWNGKLSPEGYGRFRVKDGDKWNTYGSHRVSYSIFKGEIKKEMMIDHVCRNRKCVSPYHLRQVDAITNVHENSLSITHIASLKTHCIKGHKFTPDNLVLSKNGRRCKACHRERSTKNNQELRIKKSLLDPNYKTRIK